MGTIQTIDHINFLDIDAIAMDVHGTLVERTVPDDLEDVRLFRERVAHPAKKVGLPVVMVSAGPSRELERVGGTLALDRNPALYELGHLYTPSLLSASPRFSHVVSHEARSALHDLKGLLLERLAHLAPGAYLEPKVILVSINVKHANSSDRQRLLEGLRTFISCWKMPLVIHQSDVTVDIGAAGVGKATSLQWLLEDLMGRPAEKIAACGDSRNDLDLLAVGAFGMVGCPLNADSVVKEFVKERHGVISKYAYLHGTIDAVLRMFAARTRRSLAIVPGEKRVGMAVHAS